MAAALKGVVETWGKNDSGSPQDDLDFIKLAAASQAQQIAASRRQMLNDAHKAIASVHHQVCAEVGDMFVPMQTGHGAVPNGMGNILGMARAEDHSIKFMPTFVASIAGDEIVITVDGAPFFRSGADNPDYGEKFRYPLRALYLKGLRSIT
jgi:hypothetical protein